MLGSNKVCIEYLVLVIFVLILGQVFYTLTTMTTAIDTVSHF